MAEETVTAFDPDDLPAALYRLRDAVFLAIDEEGTTGSLRQKTTRDLLLLAGDVRVTARRLGKWTP